MRSLATSPLDQPGHVRCAVRVTCNSCGRDFLFLLLDNSTGEHVARCPHCRSEFGMAGAGHLPLLADRAATGLVRALRSIAARQPAFTAKAHSELDGIEEAVHELAHGSRDPRAVTIEQPEQVQLTDTE